MKWFGIDLSDFPAGESIENPIERNILGTLRRNEDITPPSLAEYAITDINHELHHRTNQSRKAQQYYSWNTLR